VANPPNRDGENDMAITLAKQQGEWVYVYDGSRQLWSRVGKLHGYTGASVNIQNGSFINSYDERGNQLASIPVW
jgi:hypothetical protein